MKEKPILFSAPMVRAILDGSKTQTRRGFNDRTKLAFECAAKIGEVSHFLDQPELGTNDIGYVLGFCPYGQPGDRLWVREAFSVTGFYPSQDNSTEAGSDEECAACRVRYHADGSESYIDELSCNNDFGVDEEHQALRASKKKSVPSIHMARWASRITLEITNIRVERLNDISEEDAKAEGLKYHSLYNEWGGVEAHPASRPNCPKWRWYEKPSEAFKYLWESINGPESWSANPWVWVVEFKRI